MKHLITFLLFSGICLGQGVRFGDSVPTQSTTTVPGVSSNIVIAVPGATINFCSSPANAVPCTNKATTFTDSTLTIACASSTQIVLAGTNSCVATTDARGNWGVWVKSGTYEYTVTVNGVSSGPFEATPGGSGTGGVACTLGAIAVPWFNGTTTLCDPALTDDGAGTFGVATLNASTAINAPLISLNGNAGFLIGPMQKQVAPASPATGQMVCWGDSGTNFFACKNSDGSNAMPSSGSSLTVQTNGVSNTSQTTLNFLTSPAFNGLTLTPSNPASGNEQFAFGGSLDLATQTHPSMTVGGVTCTLNASCNPPAGAPTIVIGSSDTLTATGTFATQSSITAGSTQWFEIRAGGVYTTSSTASPIENIQVNAFGTSGLCSHPSGNNSLNPSLTNASWDVVCRIAILSAGAPGTAAASGTDTAVITATSGLFSSHAYTANAATQAAITTTAQTVSIQETAALVAGTSITLQYLVIRAY